MEFINKKLNEYLATKRAKFPRFFFVSNEELTMMLAQSGDPSAVARNSIQQCFDGIKQLECLEASVFLKEDKETVEWHFPSMISEAGEQVSFDQVIVPWDETGTEPRVKVQMLEEWLIRVEDQMKTTLINNMNSAALQLSETERVDFCKKWPEQTVLTVTQLEWTAKVETALSEGTLDSFYKEQRGNLDKLIAEIRNKGLNKLNKKTFVSLIIQDVHAADVVEYLINSKATVTSFEWESQLRYYTRKDMINVTMLNTKRVYDYEYLGNQKRLVITLLTDRCYRTMMEALHNCLGGAPEGPAGTGKTETIKDLSKNLGKKCFTYNCSETSDYNLMSKLFKGVAMTGCWICFDEFNRINADVLSVIAFQVSALLEGLQLNCKEITFEESIIEFNPNIGIFITMNPDYAGRSQLPDNLKVLFRPLAMMIPDYGMICEIMLYSFGFRTARKLAKKVEF